MFYDEQIFDKHKPRC